MNKSVNLHDVSSKKTAEKDNNIKIPINAY